MVERKSRELSLERRRIIDKLAIPLTDFSDHYPRHLGGVVSGVGLALVRLLDRSKAPDKIWQDFITSKLEGKALNDLVYHTIVLHERNGISREADQRVEPIMPIVYTLTKSAIISSIDALAKGTQGKKYETVEKDLDLEMSESVRQFLIDGENAKANRKTLIALFDSNARVLITKEQTLGKTYLEALMGKASSFFPKTGLDNASILHNRNLLSGHMRYLFLPDAVAIGSQHGLTQEQIENFIHNATRV